MCVRSPTCSWSLTLEDEVAVLPYLLRFACGVPMLVWHALCKAADAAAAAAAAAAPGICLADWLIYRT